MSAEVSNTPSPLAIERPVALPFDVARRFGLALPEVWDNVRAFDFAWREQSALDGQRLHLNIGGIILRTVRNHVVAAWDRYSDVARADTGIGEYRSTLPLGIQNQRLMCDGTSAPSVDDLEMIVSALALLEDEVRDFVQERELQEKAQRAERRANAKRRKTQLATQEDGLL